MSFGFKEVKKKNSCFSDNQIRIYVLLKNNFNNGNPIDVEFSQIKDDQDFNGLGNLDLRLVSYVFESHFEDCLNCRSYFSNLTEWFSLKEEKFREYLFSKINNNTAEEFMQMRLNFLSQHIDFEDYNNLKRYLECCLYSSDDKRPKNSFFEDHILNCRFCKRYKDFGLKAELWRIPR